MLLKIRYAVEYGLVRFLIGLLALLPLPAAEWLARRFGNAAYLLFPKRRAIAMENITRAFGDELNLREKEALLYRSFENMMLSAVELFFMEKFAKDLPRFFKMHGAEHLDRAFEKGKGTILSIAHLGSWECLEFLSTLTPHRSLVIVKPFRNPYLDRWINRLRASTRTVPLLKNDPSVLRKILTGLKGKNPAAILIDQWAGPEGVWVNFFSEPTSTTLMPAKMAHKTGAAILPTYCVRTGPWQFEIHVEAPVPVEGSGPEAEKTTTLLLNRKLEELIRKYPDQWTWVHRRWKPKPKGIS